MGVGLRRRCEVHIWIRGSSRRSWFQFMRVESGDSAFLRHHLCRPAAYPAAPIEADEQGRMLRRPRPAGDG
jgi:hypothetical protein